MAAWCKKNKGKYKKKQQAWRFPLTAATSCAELRTMYETAAYAQP